MVALNLLDHSNASSVKDLIEALARARGVSYVQTRADQLADKFAQLSDAEVRPDDTENLLVQLCRADVITTAQMLELHCRYRAQLKLA